MNFLFQWKLNGVLQIRDRDITRKMVICPKRVDAMGSDMSVKGLVCVQNKDKFDFIQSEMRSRLWELIQER